METFYVLLFSYTLQGYPVERTVLLESAAQCNTAIRANEEVAAMLGADLFCIDTGRISKSIRPRLRPEVTQ